MATNFHCNIIQSQLWVRNLCIFTAIFVTSTVICESASTRCCRILQKEQFWYVNFV